MSLSSLKECIRPLSGTRAMQLRSTDVKASDDGLRFCESNTVLSDDQLCQYPNICDDSNVLACSSNVCSVKYKNKNLYDKIHTPEASACQYNEIKPFNLDNVAKSIKSKQYHNVIDKTVNAPFCESIKTRHKLITNSEIKSRTKPETLFDEHILSCAQDGNLLTPTFSDYQLEEVSVYTYEPKGKVSNKQNQSFKRIDHTPPNQVKTKLRSMWNNMKYGWRVKREVNLKVDSAVWLLGRCYHNKLNESTSLSQDVSKQLKLDLLSKIWLTYRINFQTIPGTEFVSDSGWGCMLRCGQMMMAQALVCHFLNRDWRITLDQPEETKYQYKMILRWFGDSLSDASPFSLHHLVSLGVNYGRKAGDWYGPTHVAQVLRDALSCTQQDHPQLKNTCMYVALDGIVFKQDVEDLCCGSVTKQCEDLNTDSLKSTSANVKFPSDNCAKRSVALEEDYTLRGTDNFHSEVTKRYIADIEDSCPSYSEFGPPSFNTAQNKWKSLILFVSVRLGNDRINPFYIPCLKSLLAYEHCIGIIGGRPKHALYFIGWQEDKLIHMDPHACQPFVDVEKEDFNEKSFHSSSIRTMSFTEMDPSCAIGFYFRMEEEFRHFIEKFSEITAPMKRNLDYPVFALADGRRSDIEEIDSSCNAYVSSSFSNTSNTAYKEDDDYILL